MDYITILHDGQEVVVEAEEILIDGRFNWRERKSLTLRLADLYELAGLSDYASRARTCATWLQYGVSQDGSKQLSAANFCQLRLCPLCSVRRARRNAYRLSRVLDTVEASDGVRYVFLTLTIRNCSGEALGDTLQQLTKGWDRLLRQRPVRRAVKGWFRALEITRRGKGYHPHIHAILAVEPSYFSRSSGLYITQADWVSRWKQVLRVDYRPSVYIRVTRDKGGSTVGRAASLEAAKYTVKDSDYIDPHLRDDVAAAILRDYTLALHRRRLTAFGGVLKVAARRLDAGDLDGGDLVHLDDGTVRDDVAELIETYNWHFGAGDYILAARDINPLRVQRD